MSNRATTHRRYMEKHFYFKEMADGFFGPKEAVHVYQELHNQGLIPKYSQPFVFFSPTANRATHEHAIWKKDFGVRDDNTIVIAGDLLANEWEKHTHPDIKKDAKMHNSGFSFLTIDADQPLPFPNNSLDAVWDVGGRLWEYSKDETAEKLMSIIEEYRRVLKQNGIIVFDAFSGIPILPNGKQYVRSTYGRMSKMNYHATIRREIGKLFSFHKILDTHSRMIALQKK